MNASYRLGTTLVLATVLLSVPASLLLFGLAPRPTRAAQELGDHPFPIGTFALTEQSGRTVTDADFADRVAIVSFIFTRCPLSCPRITSVMKGLQSRLAGTGVTLVSISVDPSHDTPEVLAAYARRFDADPARWWFLTGPPSDVVDLIRNRFRLPVQSTSEAEQQAGAEAVEHSDRLALVIHGQIVGFFDSNDRSAVDSLIERARRHDRGVAPWAKSLPAVNAGLNASCALLLLLGWFCIRTGKTRAHMMAMIACVVVSALFLTCYLVYHYQVGSVAFKGVGAVRVVYFTVLLSHTVLATFGVVPLVAITLTRAIQRKFDRHARIAQLTFPIWMYVSITGVVIYVMLYQLPLAATAATL
ncbi:MAG: DUF420 domain-containing protein [Isosphaeraceae bacterium]